MDTKPLHWRVPLCFGLAELFIFVVIATLQPNIAFFVYVLVIGPILLLASIFLLAYALIRKGRPHRRTLFASLVVIWAVPASLFVFEGTYPSEIRNTARWLLWSPDYKKKVLEQPQPPNGELKHIEWDGWGFPGAGDTYVYLVFDPTDALAAAARSDQPGKFNGLPCEVPLVTRLERQWYSVTLYTDYDWSACSSAKSR